MSINFKDIEIPKSENYVKPGFWKLAPVKAEMTASKDGKQAMVVTFTGEHGKINEKFWLTDKAYSRLQYLHAGLYQKKLEKAFNSHEQIVEYFNTLFEKKAIYLNIIVGGEQSAKDGKVYARLPFNNFIVNSDNFEEGAFEPGSVRYLDVVKMAENAPKQHAAHSTDDMFVSPNSQTGESTDKFPWEE